MSNTQPATTETPVNVSLQAITFIDVMKETEDPIEVCMMWEFIAANLDVTTIAQIHKGIKEKLVGMLASDAVEIYLQTTSRKRIVESRMAQLVLYARPLTKEESIVVAMAAHDIPWTSGLQLLKKHIGKTIDGEYVSKTMIGLQKLREVIAGQQRTDNA
jgi:hypothetical protein